MNELQFYCAPKMNLFLYKCASATQRLSTVQQMCVVVLFCWRQHNVLVLMAHVWHNVSLQD